ncbi:MAG: DEAD/DEAH box helicase, partial [Tomitella sp.]|nr:DEAD/DEAH box helicase [Tomitella sp.]
MTAIPAKFSEPTRRWFGEAFGSPTPAQEQAWEAISTGLHTLVVAPTGSGKTLAAFLWAIDRLAAAKASSAQAPDRTHHDGKSPGAPPATRVVYVSPLKALAVDIERNLNAPLAGIAEASVREGHEPPPVTVGVRSGDTTSSERRRLVRTPPDILITTPESLYLMLTSAARQTLTAVETVIVDEVHSVAGTKRGAHLAVSLERLDMQLDRPSRRIGLSATARPHSEVARFLGGAADVHVVAPAQEKRWDLSVRVPVDDMTAPPPRGDGPSGVAAAGTDPAPVEAPSIWPHLENEIADLIEQHSSTIVFTNSRRLTERLTARLNEIHADRSGLSVDREGRPPALLGSPTEVAYAHPAADAADAHPVSAPDKRPSQDAAREEAYEDALFARAHHGSVSKDRRARIEDDLKNARLRCVVATSSLELGIDMGEVDLVIQVESPPSVASGLQRIGRSGHHVGDVSKGVLVPKHRADLLHCAVTADRMRVGAIEALAVTSNPLDVLAQQTIAQTAAVDTLDVENWFEALRRSAPFASLPRSAFDATLDMISGRYPSDEFAELRPR